MWKLGLLVLSLAACKAQEPTSVGGTGDSGVLPADPELWEAVVDDWTDLSACPEQPAEPDLEAATAVTWGGDGDDVVAAGGVGSDGNAYLAGVTRSFTDRSRGNLFAVRLDSGGGVAWAREWGGADEDEPPVAGQRSEGAGTAGAAAVSPDGHLFVAGRTSSHDAGYSAAVLLKYAPDGELAWEQLWKPTWGSENAGSNAEAYALDLCGDRLVVAGTTGADQGAAEAWVFVLVLDAGSGELLYQRAFDPSPGRKDLLHAVRCGPEGTVYAAGWEGKTSNGLLLRLEEGELDWLEVIPIGYGASFSHLDVDARGHAFLAADIEAIESRLEALEVDAAGEVVWARTYNDAGSNRSKASLVRLAGCGLWLGGMGAFEGFDQTAGDSLVLRLGADGGLLAGYSYFTGVDTGSTTADRVQSLAIAGDTLHVIGSIWPAGPSGENYVGAWQTPEVETGELALHDLDPERREEVPESDLRAGQLRDAAEVLTEEHTFTIEAGAVGGPAEERQGSFGTDGSWLRLPLAQ